MVWNLRPDVNILSGVNGVGKSTILNRSVGELQRVMGDVRLTFSPEEATGIRFDVIRSFDRPLLRADILDRIADAPLATELDWQLYQLQRRYLDYQVNVGNRILEMFTSGATDAHQRAQEMAADKTCFHDLVDDLFQETGKTINRHSNEIQLEQMGEMLNPYQLSSGEKQMLVILLTVLVEDKQPYALFMDEPEVSRHIEWQQRLIEIIRTLNPNVQIILTTHSPAVVMNGWMDAVTDVADIVS